MSPEEKAQQDAKLQKLQKKLKKLQAKQEAGGDDEELQAAVARVQKKLKKLQKGPAADSMQEDAPTPSGSKGGKRTRESSEDDDEDSEDQQQQQDSSKKSKKQKNGSKGSPASSNGCTPSEGPRGMAQVGNKELANKGKTILKCLYTEHADVAKMSASDVSKVLHERSACLEGTSIKPVTKFEHLGLSAPLMHATREFVSPSPIQAVSWPLILSGHDMVGIAATGSGKTLAFGLPMVAHVQAQRDAGVVSGKGPFALVMAPTRELAIQIAQVLDVAGSQVNVRVLCVYGGVPKKEQVDALKRGVEIVVGTPGRLEDLMNEGTCKLQAVTYLVLDEADRMLDLGFEPHIRAICNTVRSDRQTLMFSATWPSAVQKLAAQFLCNPLKVTIGSQDLAASHSIAQVVEVIDLQARDRRLLELLKKYHSSRSNRVIIFVLYKKEAPRVEQLLSRNGWKAAAIHGDISQDQRTAAVEMFKSGKCPLLIATDVAARGLDIPDVEVVINYSFPLTTEDYVHRIGRTGRAGKKGIAHTFFCASMDKPRAGELINVLREAGQTVPEELLKFGTAVKKKESKLYGSHFKDVDINAKAKKMTFDSDDE